MVGASGHFGHEKGLDIVLQAFRRMLGLPQNNSLKLLVLGDGNKERRSKYFSGSLLPVTDVSLFLVIDRMRIVGFKRSTFFFTVPRQEAFGLVVTESMATGIPVVATRVGGIPEIIEDGVTGRLVRPEPRPVSRSGDRTGLIP